MPFEEQPVCGICQGAGVITVDDLTDCLCQCARTRMMRAHLGPEIASAKKIDASPLFQRGATPTDPPVADRTKENLFIQGRWVELISHFRYALICKGLMFRFLVITDEKIKTVFVGAESYKERTREERDG